MLSIDNLAKCFAILRSQQPSSKEPHYQRLNFAFKSVYNSRHDSHWHNCNRSCVTSLLWIKDLLVNSNSNFIHPYDYRHNNDTGTNHPADLGTCAVTATIGLAYYLGVATITYYFTLTVTCTVLTATYISHLKKHSRQLGPMTKHMTQSLHLLEPVCKIATSKLSVRLVTPTVWTFTWQDTLTLNKWPGPQNLRLCTCSYLHPFCAPQML